MCSSPARYYCLNAVANAFRNAETADAAISAGCLAKLIDICSACNRYQAEMPLAALALFNASLHHNARTAMLHSVEVDATVAAPMPGRARARTPTMRRGANVPDAKERKDNDDAATAGSDSGGEEESVEAYSSDEDFDRRSRASAARSAADAGAAPDGQLGAFPAILGMIRHAMDEARTGQRTWKRPGVMADGKPAPELNAGPQRIISFGVATLRSLTQEEGSQEMAVRAGIVPLLLELLSPQHKSPAEVNTQGKATLYCKPRTEHSTPHPYHSGEAEAAVQSLW